MRHRPFNPLVWIGSLTCLSIVLLATPTWAAEPLGVVSSEFIYDTAPFKSCHASTIVDTKTGLVAAWFGGTEEGNKDVGIWLSRHDGPKWTAPVEVANGMQDGGPRVPCWNPVLHQPEKGPLALFYKSGPSPRAWWGMVMRSTDGGKTWSKPERLPAGQLGPIKNKPVVVDGDLFCGSSTEDNGWRVHIERLSADGKSWTKTEPLNDGKTFGAIQPAILTHRGGELQVLCRSRQNKIVESWSRDRGQTWSPLKATSLPNPNSGIDAVTLPDGRALLVYNHTGIGRSPLNVAVSDDGKAWQAALVLEKEAGEYSYPAVIAAANGQVHITYTWKREKVKHVVVDPAKLVLRPIVEGKWPSEGGK